MHLAGEYIFEASRETVWDALQDPDVLGKIMPGGEAFEEVAEDEFSGFLNIKIGPVQGRFEGTIKLSDKVPPESYHMTVDGRGGPGFVKATGSLELDDRGERTLLTYALDAQIGGRLASVGQRLVDASARSIARQSLEALNAYLTTQNVSKKDHDELPFEGGAASANAPDGNPERKPTGGPDAPAYQAPSQRDVAMNVARDVAGDLVPAGRRPLVVAVAVLVLATVLYLVFR